MRIFATLASALVASLSISASAVTPLWLRDVAISPDGQTIAFTYKGDIFTVPVTGGNATRLTTLPSYEQMPVWSPDSKQIAFASDRNGGSDIYIMPAAGGNATRLTFHSTTEIPETFSPDGKQVIFSAAIQDPASSLLFPTGRLTELYSVDIENPGVTRQILASPARNVRYLPGADGSFVYYDVKGMENHWRKHHTSSVTRDIWKFDATTGRHTNLTSHPGEDMDPALSKDGLTMYFLSERDGKPINVYSMPVKGPVKPTAVTNFTTHPVRFLTAADNGTLAMGYNGEIYTMRPGSDAAPRRVDISLVLDEQNEPKVVSIGRGISDAAISPDGKQIAIVKRGDVFVGSVEHSSVKRVTNTGAPESDVCWGNDNRTLYYTSQRNGNRNIYVATMERKDDPTFSLATLIDEEALFDADGIDRENPTLSPDGKKLAFIRNRNSICVLNLADRSIVELTDSTLYPRRDASINFSWSPDSKWIVAELIGSHRDPYTDIILIDAQNGQTTNLTESGYFDEQPRWVMDGNAILFMSERYGMRNHASWGSMSDVMLVFLNRDAYDRFRLNDEDYELLKEVEKSRPAKKKESADNKKKKKKKDEPINPDDNSDTKDIVVDFKGLQDRIIRLTPNSSDISDAIITDDNLYYLSSIEQGYDLWKLDLRSGDTRIISKLDAGRLSFDTDSKGKVYLLGSNMMKSLDTKSDKLKTISISGSAKIDAEAERKAMFDEVVMQEREMFYTPTMHGVDWDMMTENYRRFLPHINNNYDFSEMLSELLGELNVSHTGSGYRGEGPADPVGNLGLLYDMTYSGPGLRVEEVVADGPFDHATLSLKSGDIITAINGRKLTPVTNVDSLLFNTISRKTLVTYRPSGSTSEQSVVILPISNGRMSDLLYRRWVKRNEEIVDSLSGGRLGYVHLESMDDDSFRNIYSKILGKYTTRDGIVIDTRWNGGGRLHEDIEILFSGNKYFTQVIRGQEGCDMPSRRWNKPSIMLQCEANYSNAHGTPWVYKHRGLGKLVGAPVPGTMTSVNWITLQDPTLYFGIPVIGYELPDGSYLENSQLEPDILILNDPSEIVKGHDSQLKTAVDTLLKDIDSAK